MSENSNNKVLVCIDSNQFNSVLVQKAIETAYMFECEIEGVYVETAKHYKIDEKSILQLRKNLRRAENKGVAVHRITGITVDDSILQFATENGFNKIFVGVTPKNQLVRMFKPSIYQQLARNKSIIEVNALPLPKKKSKSKILKIITEKHNLIGYLSSAIIIALAVLIGKVLDVNNDIIGFHLSLYNKSLIVLLVVLYSAARFGFLPGLMSAVLGFISFNFFFVRPEMHFSIDTPEEYLNLAIFLSSAFIISTFGGLSREQIRNLRLREAQSQSTIRLNEIVANITDEEEAVKLLHKELANISNTKTIIFLLDKKKNIRVQSSEITGFTNEDRKLLKEVIKKEEARKINFLNKSKFHFEPIIFDTEMLGFLAIEETEEMARNMPRLYESLAKQCGLVLRNVNYAIELENTKINTEREQLRSALLSSVSHDLKTPLASIIGSLSAVKQMGASLSKEASDELILTALEEAERLNGFISNILDMTKLESKAVELNRNWFSFEEMVSQVLKSLKFRAKGHIINFKNPAEDIMLNVDRMLFTQVLQNIIDNAIKYSPNGSEVSVAINIDKSGCPEISVSDQGSGIDKKDRSKVFDKFSRLKRKDHQVAGTGLGLAICKIIIDQHDGDINIEDNKPNGTIFKIKLKEHKINGE